MVEAKGVAFLWCEVRVATFGDEFGITVTGLGYLLIVTRSENEDDRRKLDLQRVISVRISFDAGKTPFCWCARV